MQRGLVARNPNATRFVMPAEETVGKFIDSSDKEKFPFEKEDAAPEA